jgi:hypothetical protein
MKPSASRKLLAALIVALGVSFVAACNKSLPNDGADAKAHMFDNPNRVRYIELPVIAGDPLKGQLRGNVYNTSLVPGLDVKTVNPNEFGS